MFPAKPFRASERMQNSAYKYAVYHDGATTNTNKKAPDYTFEEDDMSKEFPTKTQANRAKPTGYTVRKKRNGMWVYEKPKSKIKEDRIYARA